MSPGIGAESKLSPGIGAESKSGRSLLFSALEKSPKCQYLDELK